MAQIRTIDGERHNVLETKDQLDNILYSLESLETGLIKATLIGSVTSWADGLETYKKIYEPVTFIRSNIIMYY